VRQGNPVMMWRLVPMLAAALLISACNDQVSSGGGSSSTAGTTSATSTGSDSSTGAPAISGTPQTAVAAGQAYSFHPSVTDPGGATLGFSITNKPSWATFSTSTGQLTGTPTAGDVANYANIVIAVSNANGTASLGPFSIAVTAGAPASGTATLAWNAPTQNTDGTALTDLAGFTIFYGTNSAALTQTVYVPGATSTSYVIANLSAGTYYFAVAANASDGTQSAPSSIGSKTIS
jgi:hypothetical protein